MYLIYVSLHFYYPTFQKEKLHFLLHNIYVTSVANSRLIDFGIDKFNQQFFKCVN